MDDTLQKTLETLQHGGTILYPTDTVWGIGCDATNPNACKKLIQIKPRDPSKSFIILVDSLVMLEKYVSRVPEIAYELIEVTTSPLTIIYPNACSLPEIVMSSDESVGIRLVKSGFVKELISAFRKPIVSTSANFPGTPAPLEYSEIDHEIMKKVDYAVPFEKEENTT